MAREDGLSGLTSTSSIFEKAIVGSTDYDDALAELCGPSSPDPNSAYDSLARLGAPGAVRSSKARRRLTAAERQELPWAQFIRGAQRHEVRRWRGTTQKRVDAELCASQPLNRNGR
jgi:hypothetical protein